MARGGAGGEAGPAGVLAGFRSEVYRCLTRRADALWGVADAVLCGGGRVTDLARLSLVPECGRGHGAVYDGLNAGRIQVGRLRRALAGVPLPAWPDGRIRLAADVSNWLRPDAAASPERLRCHVKGRGNNAGQRVAGWPYSVVTALGPGASSWTLPLDAIRLGPAADATEVTAGQLREVVTRLAAAGRWREGDPEIIVVLDAGYNVVRLAHLLADLPVVLTARVRSDRVFYARPARPARPAPGRARVHGDPVRCADPATWAGPALSIGQDAARYGPVQVTAWHRMHQKLARADGGWQDHPAGQDLPVIDGTLIRCQVTRRGRGPAARPMWLWASVPAAAAAEVAVLWQAYLRRFDIEHMFRFWKQQLGWTRPLLRDPAAADRWTWLIIICYAQLYLARPLAAGLRLPWQPPQPPGAMTPARVRAGFRAVRQTAGTPASPAKPATPGPGRPRGSANKHPAPRYPVGKTHPKTRKPAPKPASQPTTG